MGSCFSTGKEPKRYSTSFTKADDSNFIPPPLVPPPNRTESSDLDDIQAAGQSCEHVDSNQKIVYSESASELPSPSIEEPPPDSFQFQEPANIEPTLTEDTAVDSVEELPISERSPIIGKCQYRPRIFTYDEMGVATGYFSHVHLLGEGGFGHVYRGNLRNTGEVVAIKKLKYRDGQREDEFEKEIKAISSVRHRNLVKLIGYCINGPDRLLVLEFVPNNSLKTHLHGKKPLLDWPKRINIAIGSAKGLEYLHEDCNPKIVHRDVKADNILLDADFKPKVADFGLVKFFPESASVTHISSLCRGTDGYADLEYYPSQKVSDKSDVYSFGIVLLELITGKRPIELMNVRIVEWARTLIDHALNSGDYTSLLDPKLEGNYDRSEMERMIYCAAACVYKPSERRPKMKQIVQVLEGNMPLLDIWDVNDNALLRDRPSQHLRFQQRVFERPITIVEDTDCERLQVYQPKGFSFQELEKASNGFSNANLLKEGDFSQVYEGVLQSGERVAIKNLKFCTELQEDEFGKEIKAINSVRHKNLVKLVGYCIDGDKRLLVFEFVPNNTLKFHLHGDGRSPLNLTTRMKIAKGSARGLKYLHEDCNPRIIHRHIDANHILLDDKCEPKLGDFANAKFFPDSVTHIFTDVKGTSGYIAPEYAHTRMLTDKSDVYSYGVLLLELITGKQPDDDHTDIVGWVMLQLDGGNYNALVDPNLQGYDSDQMMRLIICAAACVREDPESRPKMSQIVRVLEGTTPVVNDLWDWKYCRAEDTEEPEITSAGSSGSMPSLVPDEEIEEPDLTSAGTSGSLPSLVSI
ncbi:serine-threonine protein kinase, plant-type, putative [Ricinus communis]|uniref:non-specific serine/threonine protein kinase n=1 Tax=Ricinus communis TaxID=3988 RepID=B9RQM7_RICCO|nr:serine-threonine protein kinase, plant-type, putative [Ricinus communis]|eukprot:XP_002516046.1 probable leucine-rich repeat receptor-like protein kinase At5g49770 [Ricinus communis]